MKRVILKWRTPEDCSVRRVSALNALCDTASDGGVRRLCGRSRAYRFLNSTSV